jgi:hypothetical protein
MLYHGENFEEVIAALPAWKAMLGASVTVGAGTIIKRREMISNSNSFNGNSACCVAADDRTVRTMPWIFRASIPGYEAGWPAR